MTRTRSLARAVAFGAACATACGATDEAEPDRRVVDVAVAASFAPVHAELAERFTARTGIEVRSSLGSTGHLYAQITHGAPFDVFLAADSARPRRLESEGRAVAGSRATYAHGRLALHAPRWPGEVDGAVLAADGWRHLAIANPRTAPYGAAAVEVIERLEATTSVEGRLVRAENVGQAVQLVRSGAVDLGFVPLSHVLDAPPARVWAVPDSLHSPIVHQAVVLRGADDADLARRYLAHVLGDEARRRIEAAGYAVSGREGS